MTLLRAIGLMSGTSLDGCISTALIETDGEHCIRRLAALEYAYEPPEAAALRPLHHLTKAGEIAYRRAKGDPQAAALGYEAALEAYFKETFPGDNAQQRQARQQQLTRAFLDRVPTCRALSLAAVVHASALVHAEALEALLKAEAIDPSSIDYVGYHGQALYHAPFDGITVQVGDPQYLATRVGIPVVFNFRKNDVAHGGQGAPLAPVYHRALARQSGYDSICILNLGGTANVSVIPSDGDAFLAFDTGPANGLIDKWVKEHSALSYDKDSVLALRGSVNSKALQVLLEQSIRLKDGRNYLDLEPPKSLDIRDYHYNFPEMQALSIEDGCATLNAFTAACITRGLEFVKRSQVAIPRVWVLCGGGVHNQHLRALLTKALADACGIAIELRSAEDVGWSSMAMEAELFAFLAVRSVKQLPLSFPRTTGVRQPLSGGELFVPQR